MDKIWRWRDVMSSLGLYSPPRLTPAQLMTHVGSPFLYILRDTTL